MGLQPTHDHKKPYGRSDTKAWVAQIKKKLTTDKSKHLNQHLINSSVYDDVLPALELWRATEGQKVYIYSSGSVQAQKLLFSKSIAGDMLPLIEGHFDTAVGAKQEPASYAVIVEKIGCKAEEILFLTDIVKGSFSKDSLNKSEFIIFNFSCRLLN